MMETTRRRILRCAFVAGCLIPTAAIATWSIQRQWPGRVESYERGLGDLLGWPVRLGGVSHPRPGVLRYEDLELADPETGDLLLRMATLQVDRREDRYVVSAGKPTVSPRGTLWLRRWLGRVLRGELPRDARLLVLAERATWQTAGASAVELVDFRAGIESEQAAAHAYATFRLDGASEPARLRVVRNRIAQPPDTRLELTTGETPLPCALLAPLSAVDRLAAGSHFRGHLLARESADGWAMQVSGRVTNLDLGRLVADRYSPHELSGTAELELHRAWVQDGRLQEAAGKLTAGPGQLSRSLLEAATDRLQLVAAPRAAASDAPTLYERLALDFALDPRGLFLGGTAASDEPGAIVIDRDGPLLGASGQTVAVGDLVETLVGRDPAPIALSARSQRLLRHLPLPVAGESTSTARGPALPQR